MSEIVISIENISKAYRLGTINHGMLYKDIQSWWARVRGKEDPHAKINAHNKTQIDGEDRFWALKNISYEVTRGEVLGVIGSNGAGKSTLLKILSKITSPTEGRIKISGHIGSLLEVGTGFHPELTGMENIYLNGAILGMSKKEIIQKIEEIIDFAGIGEFINTPVKRYSSGMYVRLAFAVAAHLDPEILIVDEVLAVGDAAFQKKAISKMKDVSKSGRTVVFVSHNMSAISNLCTKGLVLRNGRIDFLGNVQESVNHYLGRLEHNAGYANLENAKSSLWSQPRVFSRLISIRTIDNNSKMKSLFMMGDTIIIEIEFEIFNFVRDILIGIFLQSIYDERVSLLLSKADGFDRFKTGRQKVRIEVPDLKVTPGDYSLGLWITSAAQHHPDDAKERALDIEIVSNNNYTGIEINYNLYKYYGSLLQGKWKVLD